MRKFNDPLRPYGRRNRRIRKLGLAPSYQAYLQSDRWREIREVVLEQAERKCQICGGHATQVHHTNYTSSTLAGIGVIKPPFRNGKPGRESLVPICGACHKFIEFNPDGSKAHPCEVRKRFQLLKYSKSRKTPSGGIQPSDRQQVGGGPVAELSDSGTVPERLSD